MQASERHPILVLGAAGMLGSAWCRLLADRGLAHRAWTRAELDLSAAASIEPALDALRPAAVLNGASYNDVDGAERPAGRATAFAVNRDAPARLAGWCAAAGIPLVHVSTDYVFDGRTDRPYGEQDATGPLQAYGASKLAGERAVLERYPAAIVARTSTVFGPGRPPEAPHFVDAVLRRARAGEPIAVPEPPISSPTLAPDLARALWELAGQGCRGRWHVVNSGSCSRLELARAAVEAAGLAGRVRVDVREPAGGGAERPAYSVLGTAKLEGRLGALRSWREALAAYVGDAV